MPVSHQKPSDRASREAREAVLSLDWELDDDGGDGQFDPRELKAGDMPYRQDEYDDDDDDDDDDIYLHEEEDEDEDDAALQQAPVPRDNRPTMRFPPPPPPPPLKSDLEQNLDNLLDDGYSKNKVTQEDLELGGPCLSRVEYDLPEEKDTIVIDDKAYPGNVLEFANGLAHISRRDALFSEHESQVVEVKSSIVFTKKLKFRTIRARNVHMTLEKVPVSPPPPPAAACCIDNCAAQAAWIRGCFDSVEIGPGGYVDSIREFKKSTVDQDRPNFASIIDVETCTSVATGSGNIQAGRWLSAPAALVPADRITVTIPNFIYHLLMNGGSVSVTLGDGHLAATGAEENARVDQLQLLGEHQVFARCQVGFVRTDATSVYVRSGRVVTASTDSGHVWLSSCGHVTAPDDNVHINESGSDGRVH